MLSLLREHAKLGLAAVVGATIAYAALDRSGAAEHSNLSPPSQRSERGHQVSAEGTSIRMTGSSNDAAGQDAKLAKSVDAFRYALLEQAMSARGGEEAEVTDTNTDTQDEAMASLEERLNKDIDPREQERLNGILNEALDTMDLGDTAADVHCGSTMCRLKLIAEDNEQLRQAARTFVKSAPRTFGSALAFPKGDGTTTLYLATNAQDLSFGRSTEPVQAPALVP